MKKVMVGLVVCLMASGVFAGGKYVESSPAVSGTANIGWTNTLGYTVGLRGLWCTLPVTATNTCQFQIVKPISGTNIVHTIINTNIADMATLSWIPSQIVPLANGDQVRVLNSDTIVVKYVNITLVTE